MNQLRDIYFTPRDPARRKRTVHLLLHGTPQADGDLQDTVPYKSDNDDDAL